MSYVIKLNHKIYPHIAYYIPGYVYTPEIKDAYRFEYEEEASACITYYIDPMIWDAEVVEYERQLGTYFSTYNHSSNLKAIINIIELIALTPVIIFNIIKNNIRRIKNNN